MAIKGLSKAVFADYKYEMDQVSYLNGFLCGSAIEYGVEVETTEDNPLYGDNRIVENDYGRFNKGTLTLSTSDLTLEDSKRLLGLKEEQVQVGGKTVTELITDDDAKASAKGFGIIEEHQIDGVDRYRGVILCKVTMNIPAEAATTRGESVEWQTKEIEGAITRSDENKGSYKYPWKREVWCDTEDEALEYLKTVLNVLDKVEATSSEGTETGKTKITIENKKEAGVYKYSETGPVLKYKQDLTEWKDLPEGGEIEATNGSILYLAEADGEGKAIGAGTVKVAAKEGA